MISVKTLIDNCDVNSVVDALVTINSERYNHPGYILDRKKLSTAYNNLCHEIANTSPDYNTNITINVTEDKTKNILKLHVGELLFRDWFAQQDYNINNILVYNITAPKYITKEQLLAELLFEITYYKLPQTS